MQKTPTVLVYVLCFLLFSFTKNKAQTNNIHFTVKGQEQNFSSLIKAVIKKSGNKEVLTMEAYQSTDKDGPHIKIEITSEESKHLVPGDYNFGDKDDFYGQYPLDIYYFKAKDDVYSTDPAIPLKCECTIESIGKGKVKGSFKGALRPEFGVQIKIDDGSFDLDLQ